MYTIVIQIKLEAKILLTIIPQVKLCVFLVQIQIGNTIFNFRLSDTIFA